MLSRLLPLLLPLLVAAGAQEPGAYRDQEIVQVEGRVQLVGNAPLERLVLKTQGEAGETVLYLPPEMQRESRVWVGRELRVEGRVRVHVLQSADGRYRVVEYHLEDLRIL